MSQCAPQHAHQSVIAKDSARNHSALCNMPTRPPVIAEDSVRYHSALRNMPSLSSLWRGMMWCVRHRQAGTDG